MSNGVSNSTEKIDCVVRTRGGRMVRILEINKDIVVARLVGCGKSLTKVFYNLKGKSIDGAQGLDLPFGICLHQE